MAVDEEGTAHVVWNESVPGGADITHYCRLPRGASSCEVSTELVPPDGEAQFNTDTAGPRVLVTGTDEVAILTFRYPNVLFVDSHGSPDPNCFNNHPTATDECYGTSSKTWVYRSTDGGVSFGTPHVFSHRGPTGDAVVLRDAFDLGDGRTGTRPLIATVTDTETGGTFFVAAPPDGYARFTANVGDEGSDRAIGGTVAPLNDSIPVTAFTDLSSNLFVRQWGGSGSRNDIATWLPAQAVGGGDEPHLAGGPAGVFLLYRPRSGSTSGDRFVLRRWAAGALGASVPVSDKGRVGPSDLFEDESGRLHAAWVRHDTEADVLRYVFSPDASSFSAPFDVATQGAGHIWNVDLGAADDGGGWAVWSSELSGHGSIYAAHFGTTQKRTLIDARVTAIEVTQGIQSYDLPRRSQSTAGGAVAYSGVPLAADNWTFVRVYANLHKAVPGATVPALTLQAFGDNGKALGPPVLPESSPPSLDAGAFDEVSDKQRYTAAQAYTFMLPWQWARGGNISYVAEINPAGLKPSLDECRLCRDDNTLRLTGVAYRPVNRITVFPVEIDVGKVRPAGAPDLYAYFRRPGIETFTPQGIEFSGAIPVVDAAPLLNPPVTNPPVVITQAQKEAGLVQRMRDLAAAAGKGGNAVYPYGVFPNGQGAGNGLTVGGALYSANPPASIGADTRLLTSVAHEFGHGIGRVHADTGSNCSTKPNVGCTGPHPDGSADCGGNSNGQVGELWPPNNDGALDGVGLDTRGAPPYRVISNADPIAAVTYYDLMSYCPAGGVIENQDWMGVTNWTRAISFHAPTSRATPRVVPRAVARQGGGRTLRFYTVLAPDAPAAGTWVTPDAGAATPIETDSRYVLVARGADGSELARAGVVVEPVHTHEGNVELVSGRVPAARAASVALLDGGAVIAEQAASKSAPKVKVLAPRSHARVGGRAVTVRWRATDADGDALTVVVEYSADGGKTWQGIHSGPSVGKVRLPGRLFAASRRARLRVRAQDGFREGMATSPAFVSRGAPPLVTIRSPAKGATVAAGTALALAGDAYDDRGTALTGKRLVWHDGKRRLGSGQRIVTPGLAPGRHTIVLEGRDRLGRRGRARVDLRIGAARPQLKLLKAPTRLSAKARAVKLRLAATFPIRVKVAGHSFAVGTTPRRVRVKVKPGRTLLQLRLVLSAGGRRSTVEQPIARG